MFTNYLAFILVAYLSLQPCWIVTHGLSLDLRAKSRKATLISSVIHQMCFAPSHLPKDQRKCVCSFPLKLLHNIYKTSIIIYSCNMSYVIKVAR